MADVMDMPPEPLPRDAERRRESSKPEERRREQKQPGEEGKDDSRSSSRHKRRKSLSPPPPPLYRDRRHSPSRRSPGHKRRREDDRERGFDSRDGILGRGGYGWDYGRNRDWTARAAAGDGYRREGLLSYKQFIVELEDDILPAEAERRYEEYKAEYLSTQKRHYFEEHKDEDWLRDKYDPARLEAVAARRIEMAKSSAREFQSEIQAGTLDIGPGVSVTRSMFKEADGLSDDERRKRNARGPADPPRAPPVASDPRRVVKDIEQARLLIKKLDAEKGIEENVLSSEQQGLNSENGPVVIIKGANQVKGYEGLELLDVMLTYLWRAHGVDYYGMVELRETPRGVRHVRSDGKSDEDTGSIPPEDWEKKLDSTWEARLQGQDPLELMLGKEKMEASMTEALEPLVRKIKDEKYGWKYGCGAKSCSKLFHGPEFVHKHLKLKHAELVNESVSKVREELYFQNYMSDPNAPGMSAQPGQQRDSRSQKRRPLLGNPDRLGPLGVASGDKSPGGDYGRGSSYDGAAPSSSEQPLFDPFGGPGIHGPPFGSEIPPPPVLMPVPGAGPLGPFVPAPPDVTMRMWREHGGGQQPFHATSYDAGFDGDRGGRKGGRGVLETPPVLPSPPVRHDPRHMRSYHDLDAPEDEVTVIDYRSI